MRVTAGNAAAYGIYSQTGAIAVRLYGPELPDHELIVRRIAEALSLRDEAFGTTAGARPAADSDAYRLVNGEGDRLPGLVIDRYGRYAVIKRYASGLDDVIGLGAKEVGVRLKLRGVVERVSSGREARNGEAVAPPTLQPLWGEAPPPQLTIRENGLRFEIDPWHGQKSGAFLDQRENRALVREHSNGRRVLNLFAYHGGFSVYALAGGAEHVTSVDIAAPAVAAIAPNLALNDLPAERHDSQAIDVFEALPRWAADDAAARYDLVIVDPPSLANNAEQRRRAQRAYFRLNRDAFKLVTPGGLLASASCTAQVSSESFKQTLAEAAAAAGVSAQIIAERGHALDHPVPLAFPEGRYLKFVLLRVLPL